MVADLDSMSGKARNVDGYEIAVVNQAGIERIVADLEDRGAGQ